MCTKGTTVAMAITGMRRKPIRIRVSSPVSAQPAPSNTIHATWYAADCSAWNATCGERSL
jgi:hypothetical protein